MRHTPRSEVLLLCASLGMGLWLTVLMPVFAQESYYWCYAQHPDLSYYDHPPMVAWLIWLGSHVFGDGAIGIRLGSWLCGSATVLAGLGLLRQFGAPRSARMAWLVLSLCVPSFVAVRFLTNPDPGLCAFWMLTLLTLWKARSGSLRWWALAGLMAGCALLSKYTAIFLAVGGALVLVVDPQMRRQLRRPGPYLGVGLAALTFLPVIWWNVANDFESFRFQTTGRWTDAHLGVHWFGQFLGGQLAVVNPIVAVLLVLSGAWLWRRTRQRDPRTAWLLAFSVPMIAFLLVNSLFVQVKINWLTPAVLPLLVGLAMALAGFELPARYPVATRRLTRAAVAFAVVMLAAPLVVLIPQHRGSTWTGWEEVAARAEHWEGVIDDPDGLEGNVFFFASDYRDAAQLTRHLKIYEAAAEPGEIVEPTMAQNVMGATALQFDHWEQPRGRIGQDAIFVLPRPDSRPLELQRVADHFAGVQRVERVHVRRLGVEVLTADVFVCRGYRGPQPN